MSEDGRRYSHSEVVDYGLGMSQAVIQQSLGWVIEGLIGRSPLLQQTEYLVHAIGYMTRNHPDQAGFLAELAGRLQALADSPRA
jgi:hypothetical protein